jgi:hypothetical protein
VYIPQISQFPLSLAKKWFLLLVTNFKFVTYNYGCTEALAHLSEELAQTAGSSLNENSIAFAKFVASCYQIMR